MDAAAYFGRLARLMKDNPPASADGSMVEKLKLLGIEPGTDFDHSKLAHRTARGLPRGCRSSTTPTARSISTSRRPRRGQREKPTGCPRPQVGHSISRFVITGQRNRCSTAPGNCQELKTHNNHQHKTIASQHAAKP